MQDKRNWEENATQKTMAQQDLQKAKVKEAKKIAQGAKFCRVGKNTYKLNKNGNTNTKVLN